MITRLSKLRSAISEDTMRELRFSVRADNEVSGGRIKAGR
jgi:hypothetical protein